MTARSASSRTSAVALRIAHRHPTEGETGAGQHEQHSGSEAKPSAASVRSADELSEHLELLGLAEAAVREDQAHEERNASKEGGNASEEEEVHGRAYASACRIRAHSEQAAPHALLPEFANVNGAGAPFTEREAAG